MSALHIYDILWWSHPISRRAQSDRTIASGRTRWTIWPTAVSSSPAAEKDSPRTAVDVPQRLAFALASCVEHYSKGNSRLGLEVALDGIQLARAVRSSEWTRRMLTAYAIFQGDLHNLPEALAFLENALELCAELRDPTAYWSVWYNVAGVCATAALPNLAVSAANLAIEHASQIADPILAQKYTAFALSNVAYATRFTSAHGLGLRAAKRANTILRGIPVLRGSTHAEPELVTRVNSYCIQTHHLLRVGLVAEGHECVRQAAALLGEFGSRPHRRVTLIAESTEALFRVYAGEFAAGGTKLRSLLAEARRLTPELVTDVLRNLIEANTVANQRSQSAQYLVELGHHMRQLHADSVVFHHLRHLGRVAGSVGIEEVSDPVVALQRSVGRRNASLGGAASQVLEDLCAAAELHDDPTGRHPYRVAELARHLAKESGLDSQTTERIARAALLHDVGKVGVPPEILGKAGPLDATETAVMRTHTTAGADLLASTEIDDAQTAIAIARHHHEWWSGAGYPDGLAGDTIPIEARITALADVFDAMTHDRPYRPRVTINRSLELIRERAGRQFDPRLANIFFELVTSLHRSIDDLDAYLERNVRPSSFPRSGSRLVNELRSRVGSPH